MTPPKTTSLLLFALCLLLAAVAAGCDILSGSNSEPLGAKNTPPPAQQPQTGERNTRIRQAVDNLKAAENVAARSGADLAIAQKKAEPLKQAADKLKTKADADEQATISQGKDPKDKTQAPNTVASRNAADEAEAKYQAVIKPAEENDNRAKGDVEKALNDLMAAAGQNAPEKAVVPATVPDWPLYAFMALILILLIPTTLIAFSNRQMLKIVGTNAAHYYKELHNKQLERFQQLSGTLVGLNSSTGLAELKTTLSNISENLQTSRREILTAMQRLGAPGAASYAPSPPPSPAIAENVITFPISAADYARLMGGRAEVVKSDSLNNIVVRDPEGKGPLMLVRESYGPDGLYFIVPKVAHLQTSDEFYYHYEK